MIASEQSDVCIIGAGPSGCALAIRMAQLGYKVSVIARSDDRQHRFVESLPEDIEQQLSLLGACKVLDSFRSFLGHFGIIQWETDTAEYRDVGTRAYVLVDRRHFDNLLVNAAIAAGVQFFRPANITDRICSEHGWSVSIREEKRVLRLETSFLVDASGRASAPRASKRQAASRTLALYAVWHGPRLPGIPIIEAGAEEWLWGLPIIDSQYSTTAFVDLADFRRRFASSIDSAFDTLIARSKLLNMAGSRRLERVYACDATPFFVPDCAYPRSIKIGEAAIALDPLSSLGVQRSIQTALAAAVVINTVLRKPERTGLALQFYRDQLSEASLRHARITASFYHKVAQRRGGRFWHDRAAPNAASFAREPVSNNVELWDDHPIELSPQAKLVETACIAGNYIEKKTALFHPQLERAVAFLHGIEIGWLLSSLVPGTNVRDLLTVWRKQMSGDAAITIFGWLVRRNIIVRS